MRLYRAFATVGGVTMLSRILGFVRDIMIASALGAGLVADAFFAAFQIPNLFRRLFAEGAFNSAFVPLFAKRLETEGRASAREFAERVMAALLALLLTLTVLAEIAMPWLVPLFAPGFLDNPEKFDLTVLMTRICFPYLACMSLVALLSGILNTEGRFAVATAVQVLLNVVLIIVMGFVFYAGLGNRPEAGIVLAWGVAVAGLLQLLWLAIAVYRMDMGLGFRLPRLSADVRELVRIERAQAGVGGCDEEAAAHVGAEPHADVAGGGVRVAALEERAADAADLGAQGLVGAHGFFSGGFSGSVMPGKILITAASSSAASWMSVSANQPAQP